MELGKDKQAQSIVGRLYEKGRGGGLLHIRKKKEGHIRLTERIRLRKKGKRAGKQWDCGGKLLNRPVTVTHPALVCPARLCSLSH